MTTPVRFTRPDAHVRSLSVNAGRPPKRTLVHTEAVPLLVPRRGHSPPSGCSPGDGQRLYAALLYRN